MSLELYSKIKTNKEYLDLMANEEFDWTSCMLELSEYSLGDVTHKTIAKLTGDWSIDLNACEVLAKTGDIDTNNYVTKSEATLLKKHGYNYGYDQLDANELCHKIATKLGFNNYKACVNMQYPGSIKPLHADSLWGWFRDAKVDPEGLFNKNTKQPEGTKPLHRIFVALTDWQFGWMWQFGHDHWTNWKKGDVCWFDWRNIPHATANAGYEPRPILKISGESDLIDDLLLHTNEVTSIKIE